MDIYRPATHIRTGLHYLRFEPELDNAHCGTSGVGRGRWGLAERSGRYCVLLRGFEATRGADGTALSRLGYGCVDGTSYWGRHYGQPKADLAVLLLGQSSLVKHEQPWTIYAL